MVDFFSLKDVEWVVLTKVPTPGLVKTRLIPTLGQQAACDVYMQLLQRMALNLKRVLTNSSSHVALWIAEGVELESGLELGLKPEDKHGAFKLWASFATFYQQPKNSEVDLGERMALAVKSALSRNRIPVLIGVDVPDLDEAYLMNCLQQLDRHDLVISPAEDGGYGLLGMKQFYPELFVGKHWGTGTVFESTKADIENLPINAGYLPVVWDVDEAADVERFKLIINSECMKYKT